jgi:hypothetical protein
MEDDACFTKANSSPATFAHAICWALNARTLFDWPHLAGCAAAKAE